MYLSMMAIPRETAKTCTLLHQHPVPERAREARVVRAENTHKHIHTHTPTYCKDTNATLTSSRHSDIAVHNEIDKTENQKPNRRVAGYNTATVTLCG